MFANKLINPSKLFLIYEIIEGSAYMHYPRKINRASFKKKLYLFQHIFGSHHALHEGYVRYISFIFIINYFFVEKLFRQEIMGNFSQNLIILQILAIYKYILILYYYKYYLV